MSDGKIIKYTASAGSGKTHTLAKEYLMNIFVNPDKYRRILAVTFTNKAAAEMKHRILDELADIAEGKQTAILSEIRNFNELKNKDKRFFEQRAAYLLFAILGDYSKFSVGTIDSFFQKVFRAFARELGVQNNFNLYIEYSQILQDSVSELINGLDENDELRKWFVAYVEYLLDEGKPIRLERSVYELAKTIFSEQYKLLPEDARTMLSNLNDISPLIAEMKKMTDDFRNELKSGAQKMVDILDRHAVTNDMLAGGSRGAGSYFRILAQGTLKEPTNTVLKNVKDDKWYTSNKKVDISPVDCALSDGLADTAAQLISFYQGGIERYQSACLVLKDIYMAAILSDVIKAVRERTSAENSFVLADTGDFLRQVIGGDQTPFIYEKTGNEYDVYMIDEFQDTSVIQYDNFKPLLENSIAQGHDSLIVGDVKQSIYRFRNGEWSILGKQLNADFSSERITDKPLLVNWRSLPEIVKFNNSLFSILPGIVDKIFIEDDIPSKMWGDVYDNNTIQSVPAGKKGGYVKLVKFEKEKDNEGVVAPKIRAVESLPEIIKQCRLDGYSYSDIGILVRTKSEGVAVLDYLSKSDFPVLTADSLVVGNSNAVCFIVSAMKRIIDKKNAINRSEMLRYYYLAKNLEVGGKYLSFLPDAEEELFPAGYDSFLNSLASMPLFEISESIIGFFGLNNENVDMAAISFFQDQVLTYMNNKSSDVKGFVDWWDEHGRTGTITLSGEQSAINIMTIHKAKGLQFKVVIVPFISWTFEPKPDTVMWVAPQTEPFKRLGAFPARFGSMNKSEFKSNYIKERWSSFLDNLNLMYVAFTRAEERLYGFIIPSKANDAGKILIEGLKSHNELIDNPEYAANLVRLSDFYDNEAGVYEQGETCANIVKEESKQLVSSGYQVNADKHRLRLRLSGGNILKSDGKKEESKAYYGTVLHDILSKIRDAGDIDEAVAVAVSDGLLSVDARETTVDKLKKLVTDDKTKKWFTPGLDILTEVDILTPNGDFRRPDRVVVNGKKASIIDYKFGEECREHERQITTYCDLLAGMGYEVEEACLWYVEQNVIKMVNV